MRTVRLVSVVVALALAGTAAAQLDPSAVSDGHVYLFEDVTGPSVPDDSANNNAGTIVGDPQVVAGMAGGDALQFDGVDDGIMIPDSQFINVTGGPFGNRTAIAIFKCDDVDKPGKQTIFEEGGNTRGSVFYVFEGQLYAAAWNRAEYNWNGAWLSTPISSGMWYAVAMVIRGGGEAVEDDKFEMWLDGKLIATAPGGHLHNHSDNNAIGYTQQNTVFHDGNAGADGHWFGGAIDAIYILNTALTEVELGGFVGKVWPYAFGPTPKDGSLFEATWANLAWKPGGFAVSHDVYFGTNPDDVNDGAEGTFVGNTMSDFQIVGFPGFPVAEGLAPGTTYYWRVDEVNDSEPNSPWKGDLWSFTVPPRTAYGLTPADGAKYQAEDTVLSWTPGFEAKLHHLYFGDDAAAVEAGGATYKGPVAETTYTPGTLELGKTYYWRIDEFDGFNTNTGTVASFTVKPDIPIMDPDLKCWWQLDEGEGTSVLDWSGHGNDATFTGEPEWVDGYDEGALNFNVPNEHVLVEFPDETWNAFTLTVWAKANILWQSNNSAICSTYVGTTNGFQISFDTTNSYQYHASAVDFIMGPASTSWVHLALSYDGTLVSAYYNGDLVGTFTPDAIDVVANKFAIGTNRAVDNWFDGAVDDFRVYGKAMTQEEIQLVMRVDPLLAWGPRPANGATPDIDNATPLTWSRGDNASSHEVYFGLDKDAVESADTSDAAGVYRGSQTAASFAPAEGVEWGAGPYYWRVDENNTDGTVTKGRTWSFTVADFILVDDFESYTDNDADNEAIWQAWIDGFGVTTNGSQVGYVLPPYAEQTIVNGGGQSMPLAYDNTAGVTNSEAVLALTAPRDWSKHGVSTLSLWFRGYPASVGSFVEGPVGTFTMTGSGYDIWGTTDEFHFAYKTLSGPGTIVARVDSVEVTHNWAKAGVMIRETLDADSRYAFAVVSAASGVAFQGRTDAATSAFGTTEAGIAAPIWVKLERDVAGFFTVSHSADGSSWTAVQGSTPTNIPMSSDVYIGLAVTSHDAAATCEAKFSNVAITGTTGLQWTNQDVGILSNAAEPFYVALSNANGTTGVVANPDAAAAVIDVWTEWQINLSDFADQGVNLADVDKIAIGLGATGDAGAAGGSGTLFIDDITLRKPAPEPQP
jgi:hypothetical protein